MPTTSAVKIGGEGGFSTEVSREQVGAVVISTDLPFPIEACGVPDISGSACEGIEAFPVKRVASIGKVLAQF